MQSTTWRLVIPSNSYDVKLVSNLHRLALAYAKQKEYELVIGDAYGMVLDNGTATDSLGLLQQSQVHLTTELFEANENRLNAFHRFVSSKLFQGIYVVIQNSNSVLEANEVQWLKIFRIEALAFTAGLLVILGYIEYFMTTTSRHISAVKISILFAMLIIQFSFSASLLNFQIVNTELPISSYADIPAALERGMVRQAPAKTKEQDRGHSSISRIFSSHYPIFKTVAAALSKHQPELAQNFPRAVRAVNSHRNYFQISSEQSIVGFCKKHTTCRNITYVHGLSGFPPRMQGTFISANFSRSAVERYTIGLLHLQEYGTGIREALLFGQSVERFRSTITRKRKLTFADIRLVTNVYFGALAFLAVGMCLETLSCRSLSHATHPDQQYHLEDGLNHGLDFLVYYWPLTRHPELS